MSLKTYTFKLAVLVLPFALTLSLLSDSNVLAQEEGRTVLSVDFDEKKPAYSFGLSYGGYAARGSDDLIQFNESLSDSSKVILEGGKEGAAVEVTLDMTKAKIPTPNEVEFAYLALGAGISGNFEEGDLSKMDFADYQLAFDAKIENGKPMKRSRIELQFITSDGKGPKEDKDTDDDLLCKLKFAGSASDEKIELTSEFQTFKFELADMTVAEGSVESVREFETRGATLIVVAEDAPENFNIEGKTKLIVDNYRLIKK